MAEPARPYVLMGIVNVTPDSFSDGGSWLDPDDAVAHGRRLRAEGADVVDVGGESTRPGAEAVGEAVERERVVPVIAALSREGAVSIDTMKASVAEAALDAGAAYVNDVTALRYDGDLAALVAERGVRCCLMHMQGDPRSMQTDPRYGDVVEDVKAFLSERVEAALAAGIAQDRIDLDPGIGFGKELHHNLLLLKRLDELVALGLPVLVGTSRKSFLGRLTGRSQPHERVVASTATSVMALERGAVAFRVHDVAAHADALAVAAATLRADG